LPQKGVVRSGEAFCLECRSSVDREVDRCPSCDSSLDEEVKAFSCPRCKTVLPLGTSECAQCGMKFRVKVVRQTSTTEGESTDVIEKSPDHLDKPSEEETISSEMENEASVEAAEPLSAEQLEKTHQLVESLTELGENRAELLSRMEQRHSDERQRLTEMKKIDGTPFRMDLVESEVLALADEMADIARLHSAMLLIADEISALVESFELSDEAKEKGLAAKAMKLSAEVSGSDAAQMKAREDQLAKREEMVDRKIRGYASKRKELEERESEISAKLEQLDNEKASFEAVRNASSVDARDSTEDAEGWREKEASAVARLSRLSAILDGRQAESGKGELDRTIESEFAAIEASIRRLLSEKSEAEGRLIETAEHEDELTQLLKALDQLLGQLPEAVIQKFTQGEDYRLYEKILERYRI